jgi:hypothetical protein
MVEVFKTNVLEASQAENLSNQLREHFPGYRFHFDLDDCDRILRIEGSGVEPERIIQYMEMSNYLCEPLED